MKEIFPIHIGEIIDSYLRKRHWLERMNGYDILQSWEDILPPKIAVNTKPVKIQNHLLFIRVKNHIWANELKIRKGEIVHMINRKAGDDIIRDIVIRIDPQLFK